MNEHPTPRSVRAAVIQLCSSEDVDDNLSRCEALVRQGVTFGASLAVLPENFCFIGSLKRKIEFAEALDSPGPILKRMTALARETQSHLLLGGMPTPAPDEKRCYNTAVLIDPEGSIRTHYHKIHLFDIALDDGPVFTESDFVSKGDTIVDADVGPLRIGFSICYDLRFPELYRKLADRKCNVLAIPAAFTSHTGKDHWFPLLRARAIENQAYVLAPGQYGRHSEQRESYGKSCIIDPWGSVVAQVSDGDGVAVAELDLNHMNRVRRGLPSLTHRRLPLPEPHTPS